MPAPNRMLTGRTSTTKSSGGTSDEGSAMAVAQGREVTGSRTYHSSPSAMRIGPTVMKARGPTRAASVPTEVEKTMSMMLIGIPTSPAANAE